MDWYSLGVLIYELIVGFTPYFDKDKSILYENIRKAPLRIPKSISPEAKDIILKVRYFLLELKAFKKKS